MTSVQYVRVIVCYSADTIESPSVEKKVQLFIGIRDTKSDPGTEYRAKALHIHPERIKLERAHRRVLSKQKANAG